MKRLLYAGFLVGHMLLVATYWFLSNEPAGTAMLLLFGIAMGVLGWTLMPTLNDVGPTAPVDQDWHERT